MPDYVISTPSTPPSMNVASKGSWRRFHSYKKRWQRLLEGELMVARLPRGLSAVRATALLTFPVERRRDEGNYRAVLEKALGDALVNGGWLADDTPDSFTFGELTFGHDPGSRPHTTIRLEVTP